MKANHWIYNICEHILFCSFFLDLFFPFPSVASQLARPFQVPWPLRRKGLFTEYFTPSKPGAESWHQAVSMAFPHRWPALRSTRCLKALLRKLNCISTCPHERHQKKTHPIPSRRSRKNQFPQAHVQWRPTWSHQFKVVHLEVKWSKFRGFGTIRQGIGASPCWEQWNPELHLKPM